ncbi:MAG: phosphoethanolamine transferase CptA [Pseudomonas sp.]
MQTAVQTKGRQGWDWAGLGWLFLFFWYFSLVTHLLIQIAGVGSFASFRQAFLLSAIWLVPVLLFPARARVITGSVGLLLWATSLVGLSYFCIYGQEFSQSVIFIMFESNAAESREFFTQYFAWWMVPVFVGYSLGGWLLWRRVRPLGFTSRQAGVLSLVLVLALLVYPLGKQIVRHSTLQVALEKFESRVEPAVPWQLLIGYRRYRQQLDNMQQLLDGNAQIAPLQNLVDSQAGLPSTLVLVIGESTNRQRMSLYGYPRATTPKLDALGEQLAVFDNVVTSRPYTIEALQQALTFADEKNPDGYLTTPSIMNMMKQAGYTTYWITNQQTMTKRNTMLTTFSKQADEQVYLNNNLSQNVRQYDGEVLAPFDKVLAASAPRKLIIVHLLGTHMSYQYRYPSEYAQFTDRKGAPDWVTDEQLPTYNSYDNAVLYNDFVVSSLIEKFAATKPNGFLLYLSDHGEAVFDSPVGNVLGRNEAKPTAPMYTIPFMLWTSPRWQAHSPAHYDAELSRPYSSSNFIHTWAELAGLSFAELDPSKSLVSPAFKKRPLLIGDPYLPKSLIDFSLIKPQPRRPAAQGKVASH